MPRICNIILSVYIVEREEINRQSQKRKIIDKCIKQDEVFNTILHCHQNGQLWPYGWSNYKQWCKIKPQPTVVKEQNRAQLCELDVFRSSGVINWMANEILISLAITLENSCNIYADLQMSNKKRRLLKLCYFLHNLTIHFFLSGCCFPFPPKSSIAPLLCVFYISMNLNGS